MRTIPEETITAIQAKARELDTLVQEAGCRLVAIMGDDWGAGVKVIPDEVEIAPHGSDPIPVMACASSGLYVDVLDQETNHLYEEGTADYEYEEGMPDYE